MKEVKMKPLLHRASKYAKGQMHQIAIAQLSFETGVANRLDTSKAEVGLLFP